MEILDRFSKVRVLVVGDIMLDRFWWGSVNRISPEAPVPVVRLEKTSLVAGGAANVAANIAGLGAEPYLVGATGDDKEAGLLPGVLESSGIRHQHLIKIKDRPTTVKTRVIAHSQQIVRIDQETGESLSRAGEEEIEKMLPELLEKTDVILLSDYAKGFLTNHLLARLITTANDQRKKIIIDPKGKNYTKYSGATLLTPNRREAAEACNLEETDPDVVEKAGNRLLEQLSLESILITQGEEGMTLFQKNKKSRHLAALARNVYDVTGAGDTVIATLAVALGAGAELFEAAELANIAGGLVVEQMGTAAIKFDELKAAKESL